jgi:hypothetical protein
MPSPPCFDMYVAANSSYLKEEIFIILRRFAEQDAYFDGKRI